MPPSWPDSAMTDRGQSLVGSSYTAFMAGSNISNVISVRPSALGFRSRFKVRSADWYCNQSDARFLALAALSNPVID